MQICWVLGTIVLWSLTTYLLIQSGYFSSDDLHLRDLLSVLLAYTALIGLGFFAGNIPWLILMAAICRRVNGAPFSVGDRVIVLVGPHTGTATFVDEITRGQGGQPVPRVELGTEAREKYKDHFAEEQLLRVSRRQA